MEKELLKHMIHDRDRRIAFTKKQIEEQHQKMASFQEDLVDIRNQRQESEVSHMYELTRLMEAREVAGQALGRLQEDLRKQQGDSLQLYTEVIKESSLKAPDSKDSSYVTRMQAQLCKCMHSTAIIENQTELVRAACDELMKSLKEAANRTLDEKTNVELQFMNELVRTDNSRREAEEELITKFHKIHEEIMMLEEKLLDDESGNDSDSEIDKEEEEERRELKRELDERNEEIEALQKQVDAQEQRIRKLQFGVDYMKSPPDEDAEDEVNEATEDESTLGSQ
jgi:ADP-ribose pyrophosphatase YjhB (NUDIX family)